MNAMQTALVLAVVAAVAMSETCKEQCLPYCEHARDSCKTVTGNAGICDNIFATCSGSCDEACPCLEGCADKCQPGLTKCLEVNNDNWVLEGECKSHYGWCDNLCQVGCFFGLAVQNVDQVDNSDDGGN